MIQLTRDVRGKLDIRLPSHSFHQDHSGYLPSPKCHHPVVNTKLYCGATRTRHAANALKAEICGNMQCDTVYFCIALRKICCGDNIFSGMTFGHLSHRPSVCHLLTSVLLGGDFSETRHKYFSCELA